MDALEKLASRKSGLKAAYKKLKDLRAKRIEKLREAGNDTALFEAINTPPSKRDEWLSSRGRTLRRGRNLGRDPGYLRNKGLRDRDVLENIADRSKSDLEDLIGSASIRNPSPSVAAERRRRILEAVKKRKNR